MPAATVWVRRSSMASSSVEGRGSPSTGNEVAGAVGGGTDAASFDYFIISHGLQDALQAGRVSRSRGIVLR